MRNYEEVNKNYVTKAVQVWAVCEQKRDQVT